MMIDQQQFWAPDGDFPGASQFEIQALEAQLKCYLPDILKELLQIQNGGMIEEEHIYLFSTVPQDDRPAIEPLQKLYQDDEFILEELQEAGCRTEMVVIIGGGDDGHTYLALDYTQSGPHGDPRVIWIDDETGEISHFEETLAEYFEDLCKVDDQPCFQISDFTRYPLIEENTLEMHDVESGSARVVQKIFADDDSLFVYAHEQYPGEELMSLCQILKPLDIDASTILPYRTNPVDTWHLSFGPLVEEDADVDRIVWLHARKTAKGWKNSQSSGVPLTAAFESDNKDQLRELRVRVLGEEPGERALAEEELHERMDGMSDEEAEALFPQMMMQMLAQSERMVKDLDLGDPPPEIQDAFEHLSQLKEKIQNDLKTRGDDSGPIDPEMQKLLQQMLGNPFEEGS